VALNIQWHVFEQAPTKKSVIGNAQIFVLKNMVVKK
jgi:hypothetical protein